MDGLLIKANDNLAAFMEAYLSLQTGIRSHALTDGYRKLYKMGMQKTYPRYEVDFKPFYEYFCLPEKD